VRSQSQRAPARAAWSTYGSARSGCSGSSRWWFRAFAEPGCQLITARHLSTQPMGIDPSVPWAVMFCSVFVAGARADIVVIRGSATTAGGAEWGRGHYKIPDLPVPTQRRRVGKVASLAFKRFLLAGCLQRRRDGQSERGARTARRRGTLSLRRLNAAVPMKPETPATAARRRAAAPARMRVLLTERSRAARRQYDRAATRSRPETPAPPPNRKGPALAP
jgi:hypothetical protein